ncbi:hypothetical protein R6Q57_016594 [Mikania cordata]
MEALEYLDSVRAAHPELSDWCNSLSDLYQMKYWENLNCEILRFVFLPHFQTGEDLITLYHNFIIHFETEIHPLTIAFIAAKVSNRYLERDAGVDYLKGVIERLQSTNHIHVEETVIFINMQIAIFNLEKGNHKECRNLLDSGKTTLDRMIGVDPSVYSHYYWALCQYNAFQQDPDEFYKNIILSLTYISLESLSESHKLDIVFHLTVSAMSGENIYNFGELLEHPIIQGILGSPNEWFYHIIEAFNSGNIVRYQELYSVHKAILGSKPALEKNEKLAEKINILWLMEYFFSRPPKDRIIQLTIIAELMKVTVRDVEHLLMKSLSADLMEGVIDEVDGTVHVTWVRPRYLGITQIKYLRNQLANWLGKVQGVITSVETLTPELEEL